jgi:hypothetical protein
MNSYFDVFKITKWVPRTFELAEIPEDIPQELIPEPTIIQPIIEKPTETIPSHIARNIDLQVFVTSNALVFYEIEREAIASNMGDFKLLKDICLAFNIEVTEIGSSVHLPLAGTTFSLSNNYDFLHGLTQKYQKNKVIIFGENLIYFYQKTEATAIQITDNLVLLPALSTFTQTENKKLLNRAIYGQN